MRTETYTVEVKLPEGVTPMQMRLYLVRAINGWKNGYSPDNPLQDMSLARVKRQEVKS